MLTATWGRTLAPIIAASIIAQPDLARKLTLAPRRVIHALAAYIQHALDHERDVSDIAHTIETQHVRDLLSDAISNPEPRMFGMLDRLGQRALRLDVYQRLNDVLHGPAADVLMSTERVTDTLLQVLRQIETDPVLLAARRAIGPSECSLHDLLCALTYLRTTGLAHDIEQLPSGSGWRAILRRISSDLGRARAPAIRFAIPDGWHHVESVAELWRVGRAMANCVASAVNAGNEHVQHLLSGHAVYLTSDCQPLILACIRSVGPSLWTIAEIAAASERHDCHSASETLRGALAATMAGIGEILLDGSPFSAIQSIVWRTERTEPGELILDGIADAA